MNHLFAREQRWVVKLSYPELQCLGGLEFWSKYPISNQILPKWYIPLIHMNWYENVTQNLFPCPKPIKYLWNNLKFTPKVSWSVLRSWSLRIFRCANSCWTCLSLKGVSSFGYMGGHSCLSKKYWCMRKWELHLMHIYSGIEKSCRTLKSDTREM